ncbi:MAG: hypothetical protein ACRCU2_03365, partial [Planktothrix sp.]
MTSSQFPKIECPTVNFYHYELRNGFNDSDETIKERRDCFTKNLEKITSHLTSKHNKIAAEFVRLISVEKDVSPLGSLLDLDLKEIPEDCKEIPEDLKKNKDKQNDDCLYLQTGTSTSRLGVWRLNDTYLLRFTRYIPSEKGPQDLETFGYLCDHLCNLPIELGQTVILAGIISPTSYEKDKINKIAAECLSHYCGGSELILPNLIKTNFLGSPFFYVYTNKEGTVQELNDFTIESTRLIGVIFYQNAEAQTKANKFDDILQNMLLSYHKINFCHSQSRDLKLLLSDQYQEIEQLTEDFSNTNWNKDSLKHLPHQALEFYQDLSFLSDQEKTLRANLHNYRECIKQIEKHTKEKLSGFLADFVNEANYYLKQIQTTIGFMRPGLQLYDKLMLAVQTQVSIDDEKIQKQQSDQQQKLGQLLTGSCAAIAVGQILTPAITLSVSQYIDKDPSQDP